MMNAGFSSELNGALVKLITLEPDLVEIISLTLKMSFSSVFISTAIGLPLGAALALFRFRGHTACLVLLNTCMSFPPVVIGLLVYLLLSRMGPLGVLGLLYTPTAMVFAQVLLITPIVAALSRQTIDDLWQLYREPLLSMGATKLHAIFTLLWEARLRLLTTVLAGFGRAISEVGAVMIVGGNIEHYTRVMTTAISLETSKGNLELAMALGILLIALALLINIFAQTIKILTIRAQAD
jgi:tungstate transport system permease protein